MSEAEQREIEQQAVKYVSIVRPGSFPNGRQESYIAGATAMAEKKNVEIEEHKEAVQKLHDDYDICKTDYQKVITKYKAQLEAAQEEINKAWDAANEYRNESKATQAELSRMKEELEEAKEIIKHKSRAYDDLINRL